MKLIKENKLFYYTAVFLAVTFSYMIRRAVWSDETSGIKFIMAVLIGAAAGFDIFLLSQKKLTDKTLIKTIIFAGIVMRTGYMLYTPCNVRAHDLWDFNTDGYGNAGYILTIIQEKALPQVNTRQYYQQPFFYLICSLVAGPLNAVLSCKDPFLIVDTARIVPCASSCIILMMTESFCDHFEIKGKTRAAVTALVAFHPSFLLSVSIAPDILLTLLMTVALLFTLRWYRSPDWKNTAILAFAYGLGVMTMLSAGAVAVFTAAVFILKFIQQAREKKSSVLIPKFIVFAVISFPLGLWYSIRNYRLFGQPFGFIQRLPDDYPMYTGGRAYAQRLFIPDIKNLLTTPYTEVNSDYNFYSYALKSSLFGEFSFDIPSLIPITLLFTAFILSVYFIISAVKGLLKRKEDTDLFFLAASCMIFLAAAVIFAAKFPHSCSMDFRYMSFLIIPSAVLSAKLNDSCSSKWVRTLFTAAVTLFSLSSCMMYILIK